MVFFSFHNLSNKLLFCFCLQDISLNALPLQLRYKSLLLSLEILLSPCAVLCLVTQSCLTLQPHGLEPARLLPRPWDSPRQEHWSGLPCPPPGDLPDPRMELRSPTLQADSSPSEPPGKPLTRLHLVFFACIVCRLFPSRWKANHISIPLKPVPFALT